MGVSIADLPVGDCIVQCTSRIILISLEKINRGLPNPWAPSCIGNQSVLEYPIVLVESLTG